MFVHQQKVNRIFYFSQRRRAPYSRTLGSCRTWENHGPNVAQTVFTRAHTHTHTCSHPPFKKKKWYMCFSERTRRWNSTCLRSCLFFSEWKVFRRERTTSPRRTIYCPSLGIPHDPGMGMESGKSRSSELTLAVLSWLSDKTLSAALRLCMRVFSKEHFSSFSRSGFW